MSKLVGLPALRFSGYYQLWSVIGLPYERVHLELQLRLRATSEEHYVLYYFDRVEQEQQTHQGMLKGFLVLAESDLEERHSASFQVIWICGLLVDQPNEIRLEFKLTTGIWLFGNHDCLACLMIQVSLYTASSNRTPAETSLDQRDPNTECQWA